jgi:hypothetical protein
VLSREAALGERPAEPVARPLIRVAALAATLAFVLGGCGSGSATTSAPADPAAAELMLTLDADGSGPGAAVEATVSCPDSSAAACRAVAALPPDPTAPVPADTACTEIYGGPDTLKVDGTLGGKPVSGEFTRANGCEIDRFDRFDGLLSALFPDYRPGASLSP